MLKTTLTDLEHQGDESLQTILYADTLISTSLSTSNEDLENDADAAIEVEVESEDESDFDSEESEWVDITSRFLLDACESKDWEIFEKFLSDKVHLSWKAVYYKYDSLGLRVLFIILHFKLLHPSYPIHIASLQHFD